jgi:phosphate transport system substrate-binding protein
LDLITWGEVAMKMTGVALSIRGLWAALVLWQMPLAVSARAQDGASPPTAQQASKVAKGAGSTFVDPLMSAWVAVYKDEAKGDIDYQPTGSGEGISQVMAGAVDFGATDQPLSSAELTHGNLFQFPIAFGGIVPVVNLPGVKPGQLNFSGPVLADIFGGKIVTWDDPAIQKLNPAIKLPKSPIVIVYRADSSGTTFNFTHYLAQVSPSWKESRGEGKTIKWPTGIGASGNASVAEWVGKMPNSIGYVEYAYVLTHGLTYGCVQNSTGKVVCPSAESFTSAVESTDWSKASNFDAVVSDAPGADAYPIMGATFIIMPAAPKDKGRADATLKFFRYALEKGRSKRARSITCPCLPS